MKTPAGFAPAGVFHAQSLSRMVRPTGASDSLASSTFFRAKGMPIRLTNCGTAIYQPASTSQITFSPTPRQPAPRSAGFGSRQTISRPNGQKE